MTQMLEIDFASRRADLTAKLVLAETARREASLDELAGRATPAVLARRRDTIARIQEQLGDLDAAETEAACREREEQARQREQRRACDARELETAVAAYLTGAEKMAEGIAAIADAEAAMAAAEALFREKFSTWSGEGESDVGHFASVLWPHGRHADVEALLQRAGLGVGDDMRRSGGDGFSELSQRRAARIRSQLKCVIPELQ